MPDQNYPALFVQLKAKAQEMQVVVNLAKQVVYGPASDIAIPGGGSVPSIAKRVELRVGQLLDGDPVAWNTIIDKPTYFPTTWDQIAGKPPGEGGEVNWVDILDKPVSFPGSWNDLSGKPTSFPSSWDDVSNKPAILANPMTEVGDLVVGGNGGVPSRLAKGSDGKVLGVLGGELVWVDQSEGGGGGGPAFYPVVSTSNEFYQLSEADAGKFVILNNSGGTYVYIYESENFPMPADAELLLLNNGNGPVKLVAGSGAVTLVLPPKTDLDYTEMGGKGSVVRLKRIGTDTWSVMGEMRETPVSGGSVAWTDVSGKPTSFPSSWDDLSGKPTSYASSWDNLSGKPSSYPSSWSEVSGKPVILTNPMTTPGDIIVGGTTGTPARMAKGADGKILGMVSGSLAWIDAPAGTSAPAPVAANAATALTLALTHAGQYLQSTNAAATVITVPPQTSVAWAANTEVTIEQTGAGGVTIAAGAGVTINKMATNTLAISGQFGVVTLKRTASNVWTLFGALGVA